VLNEYQSNPTLPQTVVQTQQKQNKEKEKINSTKLFVVVVYCC